MKRALVRRTRSLADGPSAALAQALRGISAPPQPIFGAICPKQGKGAALILPSNTEAMNLHLAEIAKAVAPDPMPSSSSIKPDGICQQACSFPPTSPLSRCRRNALNSIRSKISDNICATTGSRTRVFKSYYDIVDHCCFAWNTLVDRPWKIMSIGLRQWAHGF
jgi:hypothetical protein